MLVVNRDSLAAKKPQMCPVGEEGEIFGMKHPSCDSKKGINNNRIIVRAAGLAKGYLGCEEANKQKFLHNFFQEDEACAARYEAYSKKHWSREDKSSPRERALPSRTNHPYLFPYANSMA